MGRLVSKEFQDFFNHIPDGERNTESITQIFSEFVPELAKSCNLCFLKTVIIYIDEIGNPGYRHENVLLDLQDYYPEENKKEVVYHLDNGGMARIIAAVTEGREWDKETEEDFYFLSKVLYFVYGRAKVMSQLFDITFKDKMTGVSNNSRLQLYMGELLSAGRLHLFTSNFVNIKNMKLLNEMYNNAIGDQIIVSFAKKMEAFVGRAGCVARLGGDNFLALVETDREESFLAFLKEICVEVSLPGDRLEFVKVDCRVGYCNLKPGDTNNEAMNHSSIAMGLAKKQSNSDVIMFRDEMKREIIRMRQLEESIPEAIDNREFVVYYQPKVKLTKEGEHIVYGAEALVRWNKDGQMVYPGEFVPILEKNGLITRIDYYVLESVCLHIKKWETMGIKPVCISTNFSRRHLRDKFFADKIEEIITTYQVDPTCIEIEITESYDVEDIEALTYFVQRMHKLGVGLAMDDFGSGFSSLKMLKDMAADTIKLDKSIIDGVGGDSKDDEIIVSHMIHMIRELGKEVIAEGVEKTEQAEFLRKNGCYKIQGFLFGKPMAEMDFVDMLKTQ